MDAVDFWPFVDMEIRNSQIWKLVHVFSVLFVPQGPQLVHVFSILFALEGSTVHTFRVKHHKVE